jgi:hypothetical protein
MTKRDFFRVIIKLFGLFQLLIVVFQGIPQFFRTTRFSLEATPFLFAIVIMGITGGLFVLLIYKVDTVLDWLKLDKGFDDEFIQFGNFNSVQLIKLAIIFISGLLILTNIPTFLFESFEGFTSNVSEGGLDEALGLFSGYAFDYLSWATSGINIFIGYLMLTNYQLVAFWLDSKTTIKEQ